ncbi:MAG: phosphatidylethanolamine N-methyltransferase family protein [Alphaproteobacteria bacterium]
MLSDLLFGVSLLAASIVAVLCATSAQKRKFQFWPPPRVGSWQHISFRWLFRLFVYPLVVLTFIEFEAVVGVRALVRYSVGALAFIVGFGVAFLITLQMGWRNAFGERQGLKTTGWFSRCRNPVYVATWLGLIGWALVANSWMVAVLLATWASLYALAPLLEEPWLEQRYGDEYRTYRADVPRFF